MSASEYWDELENALNDSETPDDAAALIIREGWAPESSRAQIVELLTAHWSTYAEDPDSEWDYYCQCGKWLEWDCYELPNHQSALLIDADYLNMQEG